MRVFVSAFAAIVATVAVQATAHAHFIWAMVENNEARFALLENAGEAPNAKFEKYVTGLAPTCGGKTLTLGALKEGAQYASLPAGGNVVWADSVVGAKEREGQPYLLVYHAKGAATLAAADTDLKAPAEIRAHRDGKELVITVYQDGWLVPSSEVWVQWPGGEETTVTTDIKGEVRVAWPETVGKGFVGIRTMVTEPKVGELEGKKYETVHHWTTLTFPAADASAKTAFVPAPAQFAQFTAAPGGIFSASDPRLIADVRRRISF